MNQSQLADIHREMSSAALDLMLKKNQDYANPDEGDIFGNLDMCELIGIPGVTTEVGIVLRMLDKFRRLATSTSRDLSVADETVTDTLQDLINYVVLYEAKRRSRTESSPKEETPTVQLCNTHRLPSRPPYTERELNAIPAIFLAANAESGMPYIFRGCLGATLRPYQVRLKDGDVLVDDELGTSFFTLDQAITVANAAYKKRQLEKPADESKPEPDPDDGELDEDKWDGTAPNPAVPVKFQRAKVPINHLYMEAPHGLDSEFTTYIRRTASDIDSADTAFGFPCSRQEAADRCEKYNKAQYEKELAERVNNDI